MWRAIILVSVTVALTSGCARRQSETSGDHDGHYCVCNATYCDTAPDVTRPYDLAKYTLITSSKNGLRFFVTNGTYGNITPNDLSLSKITIDRKQRYQDILGFGGAITDSASFNIYSLSNDTVDNLMRSYFGPGGIEYSMIRTPMGVSDFSWRPYSYAMKVNDTSLCSFSLTREDYFYKIPIIKTALRMRKGQIKLLTTPWSPSPWMKTNNAWTNEGSLRSEYRRIWAKYFVKYFQAYHRYGLKFWAVSPQNQPLNYMYASNLSMRMSAEKQRDWIIEDLWPTLKKEGFKNIKILVGEENWPYLSELAENILQDKSAREIISGIAVHWYTDNVTNATNALDELKQLFPEKLLINTEVSSRTLKDNPVILGSWQRGENYAKSIIESMSHWMSGWIDWNIALDLVGGPSFLDAKADSTIIVNATADEFYKQPTFYAFGHFSKYVPPRSMRIGTTSKIDGIENIAFSTPDRGTVLVILNLNEEQKKILIEDSMKGMTTIDIPGKSINTMKYW